MTIENVRETMEAYLEALKSRGDYGRFFADDIAFDLRWSDTSAAGPAAVEDLIRFLHEQAFDGRPEVLHLVVGEDDAAAEFAFSGRHIGEFRGIPATGRSVRVAYSSFYEVDGGRITALRVYLPIEQLVAQLREGDAEGAPPPSGASYEDWVPEREGVDDEFLEDEEEALTAGSRVRTPAAPRPAAAAGGASGRPGSIRRLLRAVVGRREGSRPGRS